MVNVMLACEINDRMEAEISGPYRLMWLMSFIALIMPTVIGHPVIALQMFYENLLKKKQDVLCSCTV